MGQFRNLIFEGGGVKGIAYVGALEVLEERGILAEIERIGGSSAGAINAVLLACGYSNAEQHEILAGMEFERFLDDSLGVVRDTSRLVNEFGWHKGGYFRDWIGELIARRFGSPHLSFRDLEQRGRPGLFLVGANLSTGFGEVYSVEHTPTMRVLDAVRTSMSLPLLFAAVRNLRGDVLVDGGLINNYPVKLFDREKYINNPAAIRRTEYYKAENERFLTGATAKRSPYCYNRETLGFRLDSRQEIAVFRYGDVPVARPIGDFFAYAKALVATTLNVQQQMHLHSDDWHRTIYIDTLGVGTADFGIDRKTRDDLVASGVTHTRKYFDWFDSATGKNAPKNRMPDD